MHVIPITTPLFKPKESLVDFLYKNIPAIEEGDVVVITSKIVALSQGRIVNAKDIKKVIQAESKKQIETPWATLTLGDDGWCINAGVDESNANGRLVLLPSKPAEVAELVLKNLKKHFSVKKCGVIITDTKSTPLRAGTIGRSLAYAGIEPLKSYIGKKDLYGRKSRVTQSNVADALSASAVLVMGEGSERTPLVIIRKAPVSFITKSSSNKKTSLSLSPERDIYSYLYKKMLE